MWGMRLPAASLLALFLLARLAAGADRQPRNVADSHPFIALISDKESPLCTGALVSPNAVLTSASCVAGADPRFVYLGTYNIFLDSFRREDDYETRKVSRVVRHPDFVPSDAQQNNLALLILSRPSRHEPVALALEDFAYPLNATEVQALGYGSLSADGFFPQLHADSLTLLPEEECGGLQTAYGRWWASAPPDEGAAIQACTGLSHSFRACATGNAGGPLLLPRGASGGGALQLGLLTSGFACSTDPAVASASSPALYTWLPRYADWLEEQLGAAADEAEGEEKEEENEGRLL